MIIIGLTGQSGAGKTTVCETFEKNGFCIINADIVAREVMSNGSECLLKTAETFDGILLSDGSLDRKKLADIVFSDKEKLKAYERIIYPYILSSINEKISFYKKVGCEYLLLDAPTLFESGADALCDKIISVISDKNTRLIRILKRDNITAEQAEKRLNSQKNDIYYREKSDYVIENNGSYDELQKEAENVISLIKESCNAKKSQ